MRKIVYRSRAGKTVVLYLDHKVRVTGDFFAEEEDLIKVEEELSQCKKPSREILGVDMEELFSLIMENFEHCIGKV